ncbi:MAG: hypothetical protein QM778_11625 [Myxococcales bacterium]
MSALCKAVAPAQVQVTYSDNQPLPFRVDWSSELGPISFAGATPDDAAERALAALRSRLLPPEFGNSSAAKTLVRGAPSTSAASMSTPSANAASASPPVSEPLTQVSWVEAMRERIQDIEERKPVRRANLRLVRS